LRDKQDADRLARIQALETQLAQSVKEDTDRKTQMALKIHWEGRSCYVV